MKLKFNKCIAIAAMFLLAAICVPIKAFASDDDLDDEINQIYLHEMNNSNKTSMADFAGEELIKYVGITPAEWFMIAFHEDEVEADYEGYNQALNEFLKEKEAELNSCELLRIALFKSCIGKDEEWIEKVIDEQSQNFGIMSCIYGLILHDSRDYQTQISGEEIAKSLLDYQLENGGFALSGTIADPDVTAMAVQALSGYYGQYEKQIEAALLCLSKMQQENGGFLSFGTETSESGAQVLLALLSLNIDYLKDERFIKNGFTVYDALMAFQTEDGGFCHEKGQKVNEISTSQALMALVGIKKADQKSGNFFDFRGDENKKNQENVIETPQKTSANITGNGLKKFFLMGLLAICVLGIVIIAITKRSRKTFFIWLAINLAGFAFLFFSHFQTTDEYYQEAKNGSVKVCISIKGPEKEICPETIIYINEGESAFDALEAVTRVRRINLDYTGNRLLSNIYVKSIGGISEFDYGNLSGWTYSVNGNFPNVSAAAFELEENDVVEWIYQKGEKEN